MDGNDLMALFGLSATQQMNLNGGGNEVDDNDYDFYGDDSSRQKDDAQSGAQAEAQMQNTQVVDAQAQKLAAEKKLENQRQADLLKAKLLANRKQKQSTRQNTPAKTPATPTPAPATPAQQQGSTFNMSSDPPAMAAAAAAENNVKASEQPSAVSSLEALIAQGKAHADAKTAALAAAKTNTEPSKQSGQQPNGIKTNGAPAQRSVKQEQQSAQKSSTPAQPVSTSNTRPTNLSDPYYADLPAWLEMTGYHDVEFRTNKLRTHKERRALEEEAARIAERLEKLRQAEQQEMQQMRMTTHMSTANMAPPPLPATLPTGTKRGRSPDPTPTAKNVRRREDNGGFRIRGGATDTDTRPPRRQSRSPPGIERRAAYPESRRRSIDERPARSRDPSLERRQSYYRPDGEPPREPALRYDHYDPRHISPRSSYSNPNANPNASRQSKPQYRGSAALDLRKGGVRYFMIKSWNHQNVEAAMRDNVWATQEKNEKLLIEAFNTSRHVILLFSVNKSVAFQGYALMTSAPDPNLPKPGWAAKLNWGTSATFTLRWLGTTSIPFRTVGHLKNTLNTDDNGEPLAVLVGKDGQEISTDAGKGTVWALDEAEAKAKE